MYALQFKFDSRSYMAVCPNPLDAAETVEYVSDKPTLFKTKKAANDAKSRWGLRGCWKLIEMN